MDNIISRPSRDGKHTINIGLDGTTVIAQVDGINAGSLSGSYLSPESIKAFGHRARANGGAAICGKVLMCDADVAALWPIVRSRQAAIDAAPHACYGCGSANSSCMVEPMACGCKIHRRSVYIHGETLRDEHKDWTDHCADHKPKEPKINGWCDKCESVCYGDCEAN